MTRRDPGCIPARADPKLPPHFEQASGVNTPLCEVIASPMFEIWILKLY
jgi:hypothetical protein